MNNLRGLALLLLVAGIVGFVAIVRPPDPVDPGSGVEAVPIGSVQFSGPGLAQDGVHPAPTATVQVAASPEEASVTPESRLRASPIIPRSQPPAAPSEPPITPGMVTAIAADALKAPPAASPRASPVSALADATAIHGWNPPALSVPIARNPNDHYWFIRPVAAKYINYGLRDYPYGSNGPENNLRTHHGIDLANPIGVEILAGGDGTVILAQKGHINEFESITSYGNCIVIDHDFGYNGQHIYTLYAHLSAILVQKDERVHAGQVIGLIGNTGQVTGPHVHFEVRIGRDSYYSTRNPALWMAPYVGTGVVAGRIAFVDRSPVDDVVVELVDSATGNVVYRTTTYAGFGINSDDNWKENFVFPDVPVGRYLVTATFDTTIWAGAVDVVPGATNWVNLQRYTPNNLPEAVPPATP